jgi:hypothetical protein
MANFQGLSGDGAGYCAEQFPWSEYSNTSNNPEAIYIPLPPSRDFQDPFNEWSYQPSNRDMSLGVGRAVEVSQNVFRAV